MASGLYRTLKRNEQCKAFASITEFFNHYPEKPVKVRWAQPVIEVVKMTRNSMWKPRKDIVLLSHNDTTTKEILEGGITVFNTDFKKMGNEAAKMILKDKRAHKYNPTKLILRCSL